VQVGEIVPSQQRKFPDGGGGLATTIEMVRCSDPQTPVAMSVIVSVPERVPVYVTLRLPVPDVVERPLPSAEESVQLPTLATVTLIVVLCPC
jgi:hypothetical protein